METFRSLTLPRDINEWRMYAHRWFDRLWKYSKNSKKNREKAYEELADYLNIDLSVCHIAVFNQRQCELTVKFAQKEIRNRRKSLGRNHQNSPV